MGVFDSMLTKYGAVMVGYAVVGLPVFGPGRLEYLKYNNNIYIYIGLLIMIHQQSLETILGIQTFSLILLRPLED